MGLFDFLDDDSKNKRKKKDSGSIFAGLNAGYKDPFKTKKHKPKHKDLEAYSSDAEAEEDGFFDHNL